MLGEHHQADSMSTQQGSAASILQTSPDTKIPAPADAAALRALTMTTGTGELVHPFASVPAFEVPVGLGLGPDLKRRRNINDVDGKGSTRKEKKVRGAKEGSDTESNDDEQDAGSESGQDIPPLEAHIPGSGDANPSSASGESPSIKAAAAAAAAALASSMQAAGSVPNMSALTFRGAGDQSGNAQIWAAAESLMRDDARFHEVLLSPEKFKASPFGQLGASEQCRVALLHMDTIMRRMQADRYELAQALACLFSFHDAFSNDIASRLCSVPSAALPSASTTATSTAAPAVVGPNLTGAATQIAPVVLGLPTDATNLPANPGHIPLVGGLGSVLANVPGALSFNPAALP